MKAYIYVITRNVEQKINQLEKYALYLGFSGFKGRLAVAYCHTSDILCRCASLDNIIGKFVAGFYKKMNPNNWLMN